MPVEYTVSTGDIVSSMEVEWTCRQCGRAPFAAKAEAEPERVHNQNYYARKARRLCPTCSNTPEPGFTRCEPCRDKNKNGRRVQQNEEGT